MEMQEGKWRRPVGWGDGEEPKAGWAANVWYGQLDPAWMDSWWREQALEERDGRRWRTGMVELRRLAERAVKGCNDVWRVACSQIWGRKIEQEQKAAAKSRKAGMERRVANRRAIAQSQQIDRHEAEEVGLLRKQLVQVGKAAGAATWSDEKVLAWGQARRNKTPGTRRRVGGKQPEVQETVGMQPVRVLQGGKRLVQISLFKCLDMAAQRRMRRNVPDQQALVGEAGREGVG